MLVISSPPINTLPSLNLQLNSPTSALSSWWSPVPGWTFLMMYSSRGRVYLGAGVDGIQPLPFTSL